MWERTLRYVVEDRADVLNRPTNEPGIGAVWHNRLLILPDGFASLSPDRRGGAALISASRDGAWIAGLVREGRL